MFVSNKNSYENEARAISYKNAQEALKDNSFLKFSEEHQGASFDVADGNWLNFLDNEQFLFMPGIIVISADTSHLKTWLAQAISVGALIKNPGVVKKIIHMDFDTTMATYKYREITPFNMEYLDKNGRKISCRIDTIAKNMELLSNQGYYQYVDNRQLSLYCEKYNADGITPYNVFSNLLNEPVEYISSNIFIFDVLSNFESDVNNADKAAKFMQILRRLTNKGCGATFIILHHNNKQKDENGKSIFQGANIWLTQSDQLYQQERISEHRDNIATIVLKKSKDKNKFLNGENGIVFYLDKSKPLDKCLKLGNYIDDEYIKVKLNDNQKVYFENIMKIFDNNPNEIKITDIVNQLGVPEGVKPETFRMAIFRVLTDKMVKEGILTSRKHGSTLYFSKKTTTENNVANTENISSYSNNSLQQRI